MRWCQLLLVGILASGASGATAGVVGPVHNPSNGHDYFVSDANLTWEAGEAWAMSLNGHLVAITGGAEQAWIMANLSLPADYVWIGGKDDANTTDTVFEWATGEAWGFTNFAPGEPDDDAGLGGGGDRLALTRATGQWLDANGNFNFLVGGAIAEVVPTTGVNPSGLTSANVRISMQSVASHGQATLRLVLPQAMPVSVAVYDVSGRPVRKWAAGTLGAGSHEWVWDTTDEQGRRVDSGLYFVYLQAPQVRRSGRVVVAN